MGKLNLRLHVSRLLCIIHFPLMGDTWWHFNIGNPGHVVNKYLHAGNYFYVLYSEGCHCAQQQC